MPKRLTTALLALLTFATVLAVVPLAQPAAAHTQTKQYCAYDPFAGNQCWTQNVSHSHDPPTEQDLWGKPRDTRTSEQVAEDERRREQAEAERKEAAEAEDKGSTEPDSTEPDSTDTDSTDTDSTEPDSTEPDSTEPDSTEPDSTEPDSTEPDSTDTDSTEPDSTEPDSTEPDTTYTVNPCSPYQGSLRTYQRHRHPIGDSSTDSGCHTQDDSHCPAGHTETGGHGSKNCRKNDAPDNLATRIQYLLEKGTAAALDAVIETINNEAADKLNQWNGIDWENLHTDGDSQEKLLKALNPLLENSSFDPVTLNDLRDLADVWTSLNDDVRTGGAAAGCWAVTFAALATTKGKIAKKPKVLAELLVTVGCAIGERRIPDGSNDDSPGDENTADDSPGDDDGDSPGDENTDGDSPGDDVADENPAGNYCGPWTASAWSPGRGGVTLFVNGAGYSQYQSSYDNREWAAAQCQAALASLGQ